MAKVSIGMPVHNGEKTIRTALDSILAQTFQDFELIISDNASSDFTQEICQEYAEKDKRIRYIRQTRNQGAVENFRFVLDQATSTFFMWAAANDIRSPNFLELNYQFFIKNHDYIASTSPVRFQAGQFDQIKMGDKTLADNSAKKRYVDFFLGWHANGRYYSLFRRDKLMMNKTIREPGYFGSDWAVVLELIIAGKFNRLDSEELILGKSGESNSGNIFKVYRKTLWFWLFPFWRLIVITSRITRGFKAKYRATIFYKLIALNNLAVTSQLISSLRSKLKTN